MPPVKKDKGKGKSIPDRKKEWEDTKKKEDPEFLQKKAERARERRLEQKLDKEKAAAEKAAATAAADTQVSQPPAPVPGGGAAPAPAAVTDGLRGLLAAAVGFASAGGAEQPAMPPAAASATAPSVSAAPTAPIAGGRRRACGKAAANAAAAAPPEPPGPPDGAPPARTPLELEQVVLDSMQLPDGWSFGLAQLQGRPQLYFWPSALPDQRWTTWRSPLDAPSLAQVINLEGHQTIECNGNFYQEWRIHGKFFHADDKFMEKAADAAWFTATLWVGEADVAMAYEMPHHNAGSVFEDSDASEEEELASGVKTYFQTLLETSLVASQEAFKEAATMDTLALEVARVRRARCEDAERWEAVEAVVAAPIERLKAIMAAAAGPPAPAARQPATAAAAAVPAALPRATRVAPSSPASHSVPFAPAASAARRSPRMADPEPPPGSNTAPNRPKTS